MAGISRRTSIRANGKAPSIAERARRRDGMALVSDQKTLARPAPVTLSAGLIILGSVSVIALAFAGIAELRSIETREAVEASLNEWPLKSLDLTLDSALSLIRASSMIAGACAAAAAVLGIFLFRRNRAARLGLSVLAIPLLVTGLATGGFMATLVAVSTVTLWLQPARDWFDGIAPAAGAANRERTERKKSPAAAGSPEWPPPASTEVIIPRKPVVSDSDARPKSVTVACVTSWVGTGFTLLFVALSLAVLSADPERVLVEVEKQTRGHLPRPDGRRVDLGEFRGRRHRHRLVSLGHPVRDAGLSPEPLGADRAALLGGCGHSPHGDRLHRRRLHPAAVDGLRDDDLAADAPRSAHVVRHGLVEGPSHGA